MSDIGTQQSSLKALIAKGKEQNYLTYAQVNDHLPESISDPDQVEDIIQMIDDMGIKVYETAPDADELLMIENESTDELAAAEAAAALAAVENEAGRTTDPVRMYMREMGTVELLTREGEIVIAKRIEEGIRELMAAMAFFPGTVEYILEEYAQYEKEERKLSDLLTGYLDTTDDEIIAPPVVDADSPSTDTDAEDVDDDDDDSTTTTDDDDDDASTGPDPEEAKIRFAELKKAFASSQRALKKYGRQHEKGIAALNSLGEVFKYFKLVPRQFDPLLEHIRGILNRIMRHERNIQKLVVRTGKMPRSVFIREFPGNEVNMKWIEPYLKGKPYSESLAKVKVEVVRAQRKLSMVEKETGLSIAEIKDIARCLSVRLNQDAPKRIWLRPTFDW